MRAKNGMRSIVFYEPTSPALACIKYSKTTIIVKIKYIKFYDSENVRITYLSRTGNGNLFGATANKLLYIWAESDKKTTMRIEVEKLLLEKGK